MAVTTNEWLPASGEKWKGREVLCKFSDGRKHVCTWNGMYWVDQENHRVIETVVYYVTKFYIYEKDNENTQEL